MKVYVLVEIRFNALPKPVSEPVSSKVHLMHIDALWHVYTILFAHNLAAVHDKWFSVIVLYREGKMQLCEGFVKEWFDRQHNTSALYRESFGKGRRRHTKLKRSG